MGAKPTNKHFAKVIKFALLAALIPNSEQLLPFFSSISDIDLSVVNWGRLQYHRNNRTYEMLMNICYLLWQCLLPTTDQGNTQFSLFDEESLPKLYEKFILEYYRQHYPMLHATDKAIMWDIPADTNPSMIRLLPGMHSDITLKHHGLTLIIDAKFYKHLKLPTPIPHLTPNAATL